LPSIITEPVRLSEATVKLTLSFVSTILSPSCLPYWRTMVLMRASSLALRLSAMSVVACFASAFSVFSVVGWLLWSSPELSIENPKITTPISNKPRIVFLSIIFFCYLFYFF
jgi:hypothetical protein